MRPFLVILVATIGLFVLPALLAQTDEPPGEQDASQAPEEPLKLGTSEQTTVRLVLVDVVVIDGRGRTVPDLAAEEFEVLDGGRPVTVDTLDVNCRAGVIDEPEAVRRASAREAPSADGDYGRKIVLAFDYLHLDMLQREDVLDQAKQLVEHGGAGTDDVMLAALNGGLRIEQAFTNDHKAVLHSLERMQHDISLWNRNYTHINEFGFVEGLTVLFDVLGTVPGPKAVVLYSGMKDVPLDLQFEQLAGVASASRCSLYPVDASGLLAPEIGLGSPPGPG